MNDRPAETSRRITRHGFVLVAMLLPIAAVGCSPPQMGPVSGKVTFQGQPVPMAIICFQPQGRPMAMGVTDKEGRYRLSTKGHFDGAFGGRHSVFLVPWQPAGGENQLDPASTPPPADRADIPERYRISQTSSLTADVVAGRDNTIDFELVP